MRSLYRLYIDESGDHTYGKKELKDLRIKFKEKAFEIPITNYPELENEEKRYLGLTGCIIKTENCRTKIQPELEALKQKHFPHNPDDPVILHRKDIVNKRRHFWRLRDSESEKKFNEDLLFFLEKNEFVIITVVIDKKTHIERYRAAAYHPYHFCLAAMLERYCGFLHFTNMKGDILAEKRGGSEDKQLIEAYKNVYNNGTQFRSQGFFQGVLTSKELKIKPKNFNIASLQIKARNFNRKQKNHGSN